MLTPYTKVWITYPNSITADRAAEVVEDKGGKKVKVRWQTLRNTGRGVKGGWVGNSDWREQNIDRDRLKPRSR